MLFIVNVAIPTIALDLHASPAQIEAVFAIDLIADATPAVTGGRPAISPAQEMYFWGVRAAIRSGRRGAGVIGPELIATAAVFRS